MNVLLDSHSFIWFNYNGSRLSETARDMISRRAERAFISPASYWEIAIKISRGKFKIHVPYVKFWREGIKNNGFEILPIELHHCNRSISLPFHHKDPFDRMLVAQSLAEGFPLVSGDATLDAYGIARIW